MDDYREPEILLPSWISKNPFGMAESRLFIVSCFVAGLIGILTTAYTAYQWRRNINLSWMKAIARSKKNPKARSKVPVVPHTWMLESVSRGKSLNCCVCLKSVSPSQALGPMGALDTFIHRCSICGVAAHLGCSSNAHKDCKCVSMVGYEHVIHQWAIRWTEVTDQPDETSFCNYCEEPCSGSFLGGSPIWCCLWCQRLVHVDCQNSISSETGDICDLGPFRRLILSPLFVKELNRCSSGGFLSSITHGANGQGWQAMATMLERIIHGGFRVSDVERNVRSTDKGGHNNNNRFGFSSRKGDSEGNRSILQETGANRAVSYADVLKSRSSSSDGNNFFLEIRKMVVCTRMNFFDKWAQIEKELNRSFKTSIVLRPFQLNKAMFFAENSDEADYYGTQGVCFFHKSIAVRLDRWSEEVFSQDAVIASNGGWISVCDLPFNLWKDRVFEWIRSKCGGLIEVDRRTRNFGNLFEARLKVKGFGNGFLPANIHVQIDEISVVVRLKALSKPVGRRKFYRQWRFPGELSAGEDEGEESQGTASTRGTKEMRSQLADTLVGGEDNGGSARVNRGGQPGKDNCTGLGFNSNGLGNEVGSAHELLVSNFSRDGGPVVSVPHASHSHKIKGPFVLEKSAAELTFERGPNAFIGPRVSFSNPIEVSGPGLKRVIGCDGEDGLRCRSAMESTQFPPCDGSDQVARAIRILSPTHRELNTEEIHLGLADVVDRSVGDLQGFNEGPETGIQELMEVIRTSEKQINEVEEGHFEIHEVLQNLEEYGSSASSESRSKGEISEDEQVDSDWDLNCFFNIDCTTLDENFGKVSEALHQVSSSITQGVAGSSFHGGLHALPDFSSSGGGVQDGLSSSLQSNSLCPVLDVSLVDTAVQGVIAIPRATVIESTLVSESLHANIAQGQVKDNQCRISKNHFDKGGQVFSGAKEETERWLNELSKYATCPIEESEIPHFLQLLQVMGLSLVRIKDMFGSGRVSNRSTRGSVVRKEGDSSKKGVRELRNLASSVNYERKSGAVRGDKVSL